MVCPHCDQTPVEGAVFCNHCGTRLELRCQNCDTANPPNSRFCLLCGTPLFVSSGPPAHTGAAEPSSSPYVCPRCNNVNEPGTAYCYSCGLPLDASPSRDRQTIAGGRPAGFWIRLGASLIDGVILFTVQIFLVVLWPGLTLTEYFSDADGPIWRSVDSLGLIVEPLYYVVGVSVWSTTIGKRALGLYVLRPDGSKVGPGRAFARWLAYFLSAILLFAGYLMIAFRRDKRGLHDLVCDTVVVKR